MHRQPVHKLGIAALDGDGEGAIVQHPEPGHRVIVKVEPAGTGNRTHLLRKLGHADDVVGHKTQHGRGDLRVGQALDGVDEVVGEYRPAASLGKIGYLLIARALGGGGKQVQGPALPVQGKSRVRLVTLVRAHPQRIARERQGLVIFIDFIAVGIQETQLRIRLHSQRQQFIGTLEEMVAHGRFVNLVDEQAFIGGIGRGGIEVLGRQRAHHRLVGDEIVVVLRIGVVPGRVATARQQQQRQADESRDARMSY